MALDCQLTPVVFDELYRILASPAQSRHFRDEQDLESVGLSRSRVTDLHRDYSRLAKRYLGEAQSTGDEESAA